MKRRRRPCGSALPRHLGILEDLPLEVAEDHLLPVVKENVTGIHRHLPAATRRIDHELRNGISGGVAAQSLDDLDSPGDRGPEVGRSLDEIALVEVVGADAAAEQLLDERLHHREGIVHPGQQDALVAEGDAVIGQHGQSVAHFGREFARMIGVDAHPEGVMLLQDRAELRRDPLRKEDRDARADPDELYVRDRPQAAEQRVEFIVGEEQRVAPREKDVTHFRVVLKIGDRLVEIGVEFLLAGPAHHAGAGAVAAVGGAAVGDQKQDSVGVAVDKTRHRHVAVLAAGIGHLGRRDRSLADMGNDLAADRTVGILPLDQVEVVGSDGQRELVAGEDDAGTLLGCQLQVLLQSLKGRDPVLELPLPIIPQVGRRIGPISGRGRKKLRTETRFIDHGFHGAQAEDEGRIGKGFVNDTRYPVNLPHTVTMGFHQRFPRGAEEMPEEHLP